MQLLKLTTLLLLTPLSVLALPAPEAAAIAQPYREEPAPGQDEWSPVPPVPSSTIAQRSEIAKRGFGCPGNPQQCNDHVSFSAVFEYCEDCGSYGDGPDVFVVH